MRFLENISKCFIGTQIYRKQVCFDVDKVAIIVFQVI